MGSTPLVSEDISPERWNEACRRDDAIRSLLAQTNQADGRVGRAEVEATAAMLSLHPATVYRLIRKFRDDRRVTSLLPGVRGRPRGLRFIDPQVERLIDDEIKSFYLQPTRPTIAALARHIAARARASKLQAPAIRTIVARVNALPPRRRAGARGDDIAAEAIQPVPGSYQATRPLEIVQIDHTQTDVMVVDEETREPVGRPWLTIAVDVFSRMVTGFHISFDAPRMSSVGLCLLHSVYDKGAWLAGLGLDLPWPVAGLPGTLHVDNAPEFTTPMFERACREYGVAVKFRPLWGKHYGGHIERLIGTTMGAIQLLPGTTHGAPQRRQDYDSVGQAVLTMKELEAWLALEIAGRYHQQVHKSLGRPPIAVWREWEDRTPLALPADRLGFWVTFLPEEERTLQRDGIHLHNIRYWSGALSADLGRSKSALSVKYDPRDLSCVFVRRLNGHWIEARYRNLARPQISLWEHRSALRLLKRRGRKEVNEDILFETILKQRELVAAAALKSRSARLDRVRQAPSPTIPTANTLTGIDLRKLNALEKG